jgi:hypothetical protein
MTERDRRYNASKKGKARAAKYEKSRRGRRTRKAWRQRQKGE